MPGEDGMSLCRDLRQTITTPIMLLTAKGETDDRITGLEAGADDYLPKPFEPKELLLRINAILRRVPCRRTQRLCAQGPATWGRSAMTSNAARCGRAMNWSA